MDSTCVDICVGETGVEVVVTAADTSQIDLRTQIRGWTQGSEGCVCLSVPTNAALIVTTTKDGQTISMPLMTGDTLLQCGLNECGSLSFSEEKTKEQDSCEPCDEAAAQICACCADSYPDSYCQDLDALAAGLCDVYSPNAAQTCAGLAGMDCSMICSQDEK